MIRIDEIYEGVFWPWLQLHRPGVRMFYCYPFGRTDVESLLNTDVPSGREHNYIFFLDQEPIDLERQYQTFSSLFERGRVTNGNLPILITSEQQSVAVEQVCQKFHFQSRYYFFHGWAALDWFRGYNYSKHILPLENRKITHTFLCPNRIIGGHRSHRTILMYHIIKNGLQHNHISFPQTCPVENEHVGDIVRRYKSIYPDMASVLGHPLPLPFNFANEEGHPMTSYLLGLFKESNESLLYVVTETVASSDRQHLTEKTFKPIALGMPFMLQAPAGSLAYLRNYGFQTFGDFIDESYDQESDIFTRTEMIAKELKRIDSLSIFEKQKLFNDMIPTIEHNRNHFYNGGFELVLKEELDTMLSAL